MVYVRSCLFGVLAFIATVVAYCVVVVMRVLHSTNEPVSVDLVSLATAPAPWVLGALSFAIVSYVRYRILTR